MIQSPYATKLTRMQVAGLKNPERDMTNRKAEQRPDRVKLALRRAAAEATA